jgi:hypothetical protein
MIRSTYCRCSLIAVAGDYYDIERGAVPHVRWNWVRIEERSAHSLPHVFTRRQWKCAVSRPQRIRPQRGITHCAFCGVRSRSGGRSCRDGALDQSAMALRPLSARSRWNHPTIRALFLWFGCCRRDRLWIRLIGANRSTNYNMLSLSCAFLKPARAQWFQRCD